MTTIREKSLNALVMIDTIATYVPVVCVVSAAFSAIFKKCVIDNLKDRTIENNAYFSYLNKKSYKRCGAEFLGGILLPVISNIVFGIFDSINWFKEKKAKNIHDLNMKAQENDIPSIKKLINIYQKQQTHADNATKTRLGMKIDLLMIKLRALGINSVIYV